MPVFVKKTGICFSLFHSPPTTAGTIPQHGTQPIGSQTLRHDLAKPVVLRRETIGFRR